ncbi:MAG: ABC transporter substrate-binding protein [Pseudomonas sp.]
MLLVALLTGCAGAADAPVLRVADQKGMTRALLEASGQLQGLDYEVVWSDFSAAAPLLEALKTDAVDCGGVGDAPLIFALAQGASLKVVAASRMDPKTTAIIARHGAISGGAAGLKGKRVAVVRGSIGHYLLGVALQREGLSMADVQPVFLAPGDAAAALASGTVDAWATWEPYVSIARTRHGDEVVVDGTGLSRGLGYQACSARALEARHALIADFVERTRRAQRWQHGHVEQTARIYAERTGVPLAVAQQVVRNQGLTPVTLDAALLAETQDTADTYRRLGILDKRVDVADAFDTAHEP